MFSGLEFQNQPDVGKCMFMLIYVYNMSVFLCEMRILKPVWQPDVRTCFCLCLQYVIICLCSELTSFTFQCNVHIVRMYD